MYPNNSFLDKRTPSPTFLNITTTGQSSFADYPIQSGRLGHHQQQQQQQQQRAHPSMKFAKTKAGLVTSSGGGSGGGSGNTSIDKTELIFPDDAYSIEFCMPNDVICKCPPSSQGTIAAAGKTTGTPAAISLSTAGNSYRDNTRRKHKNKPEISNRWTKKTTSSTASESSSCTAGQEIINLDNYCTQKQLQPPVYDVYSYAYLEPPPPAPENLHQQQQQQLQLQQQQQQSQHQYHHHHHHHHHTLHNHNKQQHKQASTSSTTSTTSSSSSTSFMPIYGGGGSAGGGGGGGVGGGPSTSSGGSTSSKSPSRNSIKALLAKSFRSRAIVSSGAHHQTNTKRSNSASAAAAAAAAIASATEKYTFTTRYGTTENLYEEVNEEKIREILSTDPTLQLSSGNHQPQLPTPPPVNSKEEQRRVQSNHFRILDELNLSLEALIMPPTPPDISPTSTSPEHLLNGSKSVENLSTALNSIDFKENFKERFSRNRKIDLDGGSCSGGSAIGDLDSGFSVSGGSCCNDSFKSNRLGDKRFTSTISSKKHHSQAQIKGLNNKNNDNYGIAMTLISPSSPFKSMRRYFDTSTASTQKLSPSDESGVRVKNSKFWTIRQ